MPSPEPGPLDPGDGPLPSDDLLGLLYRSGQYDGDDPQVRGAAVRRWNDTKAVLGQAPGTFRAAGHGGVGYLLDMLARKETVTLSAGQLRIGGPELYYLEYSSWQGRPGPLVMACDGDQYWGIHENRARVGPARPMAGAIASLVGSSWLLGERLSGGVEITYHGRRAYHLRVTRGDGVTHEGPTMFYPADAIVDAETGCLLRLIGYDGDAPAEWWELDGVTAEPGDTADPAGFRPHIPPGHPRRRGIRQPDTRHHRGHARPDRDRGPRRRRGLPPRHRRRLRRPQLPGRPARPSLLSFLHPEFPQGGGRFEDLAWVLCAGSGGYSSAYRIRRWRGWPQLRTGNDPVRSRGAQGGERVIFHVMQGQDRLDHGGAVLRAAAQLAGQHFPVF
jgi:hypothetical protein